MKQATIHAIESEADMSPLTDSVSLYELPIGGKTLIEHTVEQLVKIGIETIAINIENNTVKSILGADRGVSKLERSEYELIFNNPSDDLTAGLDEEKPFLHVRGDCLYDQTELADMIDSTAAIGWSEGGNDAGLAPVTIRGDVVDEINLGYRRMGTSDTGTHAISFPRQARDWGDTIDEMVERLVSEREVDAIEMGGWTPIRHPHDLLKANAEIVGEDENVTGDGASISDDATVEMSVIGEDVNIAHGATVVNSVVMGSTDIEPNAVITDSVIGENVFIGAGTVVDNIRPDGRDVVYGDRISSGSQTFGCVIGPDAAIMRGATLTAGSLISKGTTVQTGETR